MIHLLLAPCFVLVQEKKGLYIICCFIIWRQGNYFVVFRFFKHLKVKIGLRNMSIAQEKDMKSIQLLWANCNASASPWENFHNSFHLWVGIQLFYLSRGKITITSWSHQCQSSKYLKLLWGKLALYCILGETCFSHGFNRLVQCTKTAQLMQ